MTSLLNRRVAGVLVIAVCTGRALAGPLDPPAGPIAPTPGPEPRIAINAVNTPGDADSVFKITQPGSYYLTANVAGATGKGGIEIVASGVTIDLNGFELLGTADSRDGVWTSPPSPVLVQVRNGTVRGWGRSGIDLNGITANGCVVSDVMARSNGIVGIAVGQHAVVTRCVATNNVSHGISANVGSVISHCQTSNNAGSGVSVAAQTVITSCLSQGNGTHGFDCANGSTVTACTASQNSDNGVDAGSGCTVTACSAQSNGGHGVNALSGCTVTDNTARQNGGDGVRVVSSSRVAGNTCTFNSATTPGAAGVHATGPDNRIEGNLCIGQEVGVDVDVPGNIIVRNACSTNVTNWIIAGNNYYGAIVDRVGVLAPAVNGDEASSTLGTTDANANFSF